MNVINPMSFETWLETVVSSVEGDAGFSISWFRFNSLVVWFIPILSVRMYFSGFDSFVYWIFS